MNFSETQQGSSLAGSSAVAREIRSLGWQKTPLGPAEQWPHTLQTAIGIMVGAASPISLFWGEDLIFLYNDAWRNLIGNKHPGGLGKPAREVFFEIWEDILPMIDKVMSGQGAAASKNQLLTLHQNGRMKPARFDFSFNPLPGENGSIGGIFCIAAENTEKMLTDRALQESDARFRALVMASADVVYRMEPDWSEMRQLHGRHVIADAQEPSRNCLLKYIPPEDQPKVLAAIEKAIRTKSTFELGHRVLRPDGSIGWTLSRAIPLLDEKGEIAEWFGMARDITERKEKAQREKEECLAAILDQLPHGVGLVDPEGQFILTNSLMRDYVDASMPSRDPRGLGRWRVLDSGGRPIPSENWAGARALRGETVLPGLETIFIDDEGCEHWTQVSAVPFRTEGKEIAGAITVVQDISERKQKEEEIARLNTQLAARAKELAKANQELEAFNYSVAHDLRTPLTVISGYLDYAKQACKTSDCHQYLQKAHEGTLKMGGIINGLLEFARLSREEPEPQEIDLGAMAQEIIHDLQTVEPGRRVEPMITRDGTVRGDPSLLRVVLTNLLGNAWKFTQMREQAEIEFGVEKRKGRSIFFVRDNGIGFDVKEAEKLFLPFQRLKGAANVQGHGIGLATAARIIERHNGSVWAEGEPSKGATFYFSLPSR